MKLSIKNILKTRVSVIVFIILLIIQFFGAMNLLKGDSEAEQVIIQFENIMKEAQSERSMISLLEKKGVPLQGADEFRNYLDWKQENARAGRELFIKHGKDVFGNADLLKQYRKILLWNSIYEMDRYAPDENALANYIFHDFIQKFEMPSIDFDPGKISFAGRLITDHVDEKYFTLRKTTERQMYEWNDPDTAAVTKGPWLFLVRQFQTDSLISFFIPVLAIFFAVQIISNDRQCGILEMMKLNTKWWWINVVGQITISFLILVASSYLIPFIGLGLKDGFFGWNAWILMNENNIKLLEIKTNSMPLTVQGLSEYPYVNDGLIPMEYSYVVMIKPFIFAFALGLAKTAFYCLLGMMISVLIRNRAVVYGSSLMLAGVYVYGKWNTHLSFWLLPFQIGPSLSVSTGNGILSWASAMMVFIILDILLFFLIGGIARQMDERA